MAGVKGRSGGPRPGSGRKPKPKAAPTVVPVADDQDMLKYLQDVALGRIESTTIQVRAAIAAVQYTHTKRGDGGQKDETKDKAKKASQGKFKAAPAPLKLVGSG